MDILGENSVLSKAKFNYFHRPGVYLGSCEKKDNLINIFDNYEML